MITLATLPQASEQEVFEQVARHLMTQRKRATEKTRCVYLTDDGLKCAAGCLLSEKDYALLETEKMLSFAWNSISSKLKIPQHRNLIMHLQAMHDVIEPRKWKYELRGFANRFHLDANFLDEYEDIES